MSIALFIAAMVVQDLNVSGGVQVSNVAQIGLATRHARCIVRRVGIAPEEDAARDAAIRTAVTDCRAYVESDHDAGRVKVGDRVVSAGWWKRMQRVFDAVESDVSNAIVSPKQYKVIWQLPDGGRVDVYNAPGPLTSVNLLVVPL
ncbi:hypothetical protein [Sphingomonas hengshuiensis]|uniref:Uncharacterized protein n=1 Tax=Sphingomonas hengshuiensis TaxID=1609977 RepID=A0A7U5HVM2_9SPHN|nr:hypothetical protein [Sphingomonas hengshuiensis]AJP70729.1 hypothetical protein TS85_01155 [Sphingomonas hengshuiensis]